MKLIGRQIVVELPTEAKGYSGQEKWMKGWNQCLAEVARMNPVLEVDQNEIENVIENWLSRGENKLTPNDVEEIAQALVSQKDRWMKVKE